MISDDSQFEYDYVKNSQRIYHLVYIQKRKRELLEGEIIELINLHIVNGNLDSATKLLREYYEDDWSDNIFFHKELRYLLRIIERMIKLKVKERFEENANT